MKKISTSRIGDFAGWIVASASVPPRRRGGLDRIVVGGAIANARKGSSSIAYQVRLASDKLVIHGKGTALEAEYLSPVLSHEYEDGTFNESSEIRRYLSTLREGVEMLHPNLIQEIQGNKLAVYSWFTKHK